MEKISKNAKRNKMLNGIYDHITDSYDYISELIRYKSEFPMEIDYNYVNYGNLLIYNSDIEDFYEYYEYSVEKLSNETLWKTYLSDVREVIDYILKNEK